MGSQVFTSNGTWNWPAGVTVVVAEAIGSGGAGGGASGNPSTGGGGKGGGYAKKTITKGAEGSLDIVVAPGSPGTTGLGTSGAVSTVTQNGSVVCSAQGGARGLNATVNSTNGNNGQSAIGAAVGDITYAGGDGGIGNYTSGVQGSGAGGGAGGPTAPGGNADVNVAGSASGAPVEQPFNNGIVYQGYGANGVGNSTAGAAAPSAGPVYGGGGSGGKANNNTDRAGGAGRQGVVVLTWDESVTFNENSFVADSFTDTDGTNLSSHTGEEGAGWTVAPYASSVTPIITNNRVHSDVGSTGLVYASGVPPSANYTVEGRFVRVSSAAISVELTARMSTSVDTYYRARFDSGAGQWTIRKTVSTLATTLGTPYSDSFASDGDARVAKFVLNGSSLELFIDGVSRIAVTDSDIADAGRAGLRITSLALASSNGIHIDWINAYSDVPSVKSLGLLGVG